MNNRQLKSFKDLTVWQKARAGQSLIEVLIAIFIGALIVGSAAGALIFIVRSNQQNKATDAASSLAQELLDNIRSVAEGEWQNIYNLSKTSVTNTYPYYLDTSLNIVAGSETVCYGRTYTGPPPCPADNITTYTRYFIVENINRDKCGTGGITSEAQILCSPSQTGILDDPSTQKITAKVTWPQGGDTAEVLVSEYLTRAKNEVNQFTDWSGSSGVEGPIIKPSKDYFDQSDLDTITTPRSIQLASGKSSGWLISSTFDTGYTDGVAFNSMMWKGILGTVGNAVKFQLGSSNCSNGATDPPTCVTDPWSDLSYLGPDGASTTFYVPTGSGAPVPIVTARHNNKQYYRYKVYLAGDASLIIDDIIVNWSP